MKDLDIFKDDLKDGFDKLVIDLMSERFKKYEKV